MAYLHENREAFEDAVNHTRDVTDYEELTRNILQEDVAYETAIQAVKEVAKSGMF